MNYRNLSMRIFRFYVEGFRSMTWGRTLWILILIKLFVMFVILKIFFFPRYLNLVAKSYRIKPAYLFYRALFLALA